MKASITSTLSEEVLGMVVGLEASVEVWEALADLSSQNS